MRFYLGYRNIRRLKQIVSVLIKHGFYPLLERVRLTRVISLAERVKGKKAMKKGEALPDAYRLRTALEELGPSFIKLGQILSTRTDILPEEYIKELLRLQDEVPPFKFKDVKKIIEDELKAHLEEVFKEVEERPIAAASIAQVHRAVTKKGDNVVIKVQRPGIRDIIRTDIAVIMYMARLMEKYISEIRLYSPVSVVQEFAATIEREMDFTLEASYMEKLRKEFSSDERVTIPAVFWDITSKKILTMEEIASGIKINQLEKLKKEGIDRISISHLITDIFFKQIFELGIFHGDLHAGNIFVLGHERIALVDFGIVGRIDADTIENLADILIGIITEDYNLLTRVHMKMGIVPEDIDEASFKREYFDILLHYFSRPLKSAKFGELLVDFVKLSTRYKIRVPRDLLLLNKCIIELDGLARLLNPEMNILKESEPYVKKLAARRVSPSHVANESIDTLMAYRDLLKNLPVQMSQILKKMTNDRFTIDFMHKGLEDIMSEMDRSSNRLTVGIIIAALIIGTSLISAFGGGPVIFGLPLFGMLGFLIAGFLGLWLAYQILKSGKF